MRCHRLLWLLPVLTLSCASSLVSPPLPTAVRAIAVLPPNNQTGDPLFVGGTSLLEKYIFRSQPVTVADVRLRCVYSSSNGASLFSPENRWTLR
jgi:hypothetical protein